MVVSLVVDEMLSVSLQASSSVRLWRDDDEIRSNPVGWLKERILRVVVVAISSSLLLLRTLMGARLGTGEGLLDFVEPLRTTRGDGVDISILSGT